MASIKLKLVQILSLFFLAAPITQSFRNLDLNLFDHYKILDKYGYISYAKQHLQIGASRDEVISLALRTFQKNYGLAPSGVVDVYTYMEMLKPRCGFPDIVDGFNTMNRHDNHMYTFMKGAPKWDHMILNYTFKGEFPLAAKTDARLAFQRWAEDSPFKFEENTNGGKSDIYISFEKGDHKDGAPFENDIAHAFRPMDGRLHINIDHSFTFNAIDKNSYDLETVVLHELGHILGLGHSSERAAVMFPGLELHEHKNLQDDDILAINDLYP